MDHVCWITGGEVHRGKTTSGEVRRDKTMSGEVRRGRTTSKQICGSIIYLESMVNYLCELKVEKPWKIKFLAKS